MWDSLSPLKTGQLLSTSAHYPKIRPRNNPFNTLKLACLNGKFLTSGDRYTSMTFAQKILRGIRRQVLYSRHVTCTAVPWGSLSLLVIPLALVNGFHYWPVIKRCLSMFDIRTSFHMDRLVLWAKIEQVLKTPDLVSSIRAVIYWGK